MASGPYLMGRKQGCFKAPHSFSTYPRLPQHDPNCTVDNKYTRYFRDRWKILRQDVCQQRPTKPLCPQVLKECAEDALTGRKLLKPPMTGKNDICVGELWEGGKTHYNKVHEHPWSHNNVDDCCPAECPCLVRFPDPPEMDYVCKGNSDGPPMEDCTTYKHFFHEKPTPCPPRRYRPDPYDPCGCPLESATSYRLDYEHKEPVPNGPVVARAIKRGLWSMDQFCGDASRDTETNSEFYRKCVNRRAPIKTPATLKPHPGRVDGSSETCAQYPPKCAVDRVCYPDWIQNDTWLPPESPLERCTTYKHFYKPHEIRAMPGRPSKIQSPGAIPFSTINNIWYTCCDPPVDQRVPVEMRDRDPWPVVLTCPIKYQENLKTDPCASFRDETTNKADYYAKKRCAPNKWYGPPKGYTPPMLPFNDNTTNRVSYKAYSPEQYKDAKVDPGNPNGVKWGPYKCPPGEDKCRPRFPPPYGHPLKPYTQQCPCGTFDDRSMYHRDFKFWTPEMVDVVNEENCREHGVPKGMSLYRASYSHQGGKKAEIMPPPKSKGHRCMHPCNIMDLDSLYRLSFNDFWKAYEIEYIMFR